MERPSDPTATFAEMRRMMTQAAVAVETDGGTDDAADGRRDPER